MHDSLFCQLHFSVDLELQKRAQLGRRHEIYDWFSAVVVVVAGVASLTTDMLASITAVLPLIRQSSAAFLLPTELDKSASVLHSPEAVFFFEPGCRSRLVRNAYQRKRRGGATESASPTSKRCLFI